MIRISVIAATLMISAALFPKPQTATAKSLLDNHVKAMREADAIAITLSVQRVPAAAVEHKVYLAKNKRLRIESPGGVLVSDGSTIWAYDNADNSYTESEVVEEALHRRMKESDVWMWSPFFVPDVFGDVKNLALGAKRTIRGVATQEVSFSMPGDQTFTLYIDTKTGVAKGGLTKTSAGEILVIATAFASGSDAIAEGTFKFLPPVGAEKLEKPRERPVLWADVAPILSAKCTSCHGTSGGLTLTSRDAALQSRSIVPGNAEASSLLGSIKWTSGPRMPQGGSKLAQEQIDLIERWISQGAN